MDERHLKTLIYLWTRDATMPPDDETEAYVWGHIVIMAFQDPSNARFSDPAREAMAQKLVDRIFRPDPDPASELKKL